MEKYNDMIFDMKQGVDYFFNHFQDSPERLSGWGHNYFCEIDGGKLIFRLDNPKNHKCEICGYNYTGNKYDDAWVYLNRLQSFNEIVKSAYLYKNMHDEKYLDFVKETLLYYANHYSQFELHVKDKVGITDLTLDVGGAGKIMPQGLNEGFMLIKIIQVLSILGDDLDTKTIQIIKEKLIKPAINEVLAPQLVRIHNIACWISCAIAVAGFYFDEKNWLNYAFKGKFNISNQLKDGVMKDNLWYEGSIHYHFFMLESIMNLLVYKEETKNLIDEKMQIKEMLKSAYQYAFDNIIFPNPNDGWPNINLKTYLHVYHMAAFVFDGCEEILDMIAGIEASPIKRMPTQLADPYYFNDWPLEKLLFNRENDVKFKEDKRKSYLFEDSNFAMLRNDKVNLFLKFGHNGPSHAHPDKMTFELTINDVLVTRDLSNAGYGANICNEWHRVSVAHNTIVVDGKNHDNVAPGKVLAFTKNLIESKCTDIYPGIDYRRRFEITNTEIYDVFTALSKEEHVYDYFLHIDGQVDVIDGELIASTLEYTENGYQHLKNIKKMIGGKTFKIMIDLVETDIVVDANAEVFICETLDNPVTKCRQTIILRKKGSDVDFNVTWKI